MKDFDFHKFLTENKTTLAGRLSSFGKKKPVNEGLMGSISNMFKRSNVHPSDEEYEIAYNFFATGEHGSRELAGVGVDPRTGNISATNGEYEVVLSPEGELISKEEGTGLVEADDEEEVDPDKEPTKKDVKAAGAGIADEHGKRLKLDQLVKQKNALVKKLKDGQITIDQYKKMIGTIPQQIKTLTADLSKGAGEEDEEETGGESLEEVLKNFRIKK